MQKKTLLALWTWKKLSPSTDNPRIINNLAPGRSFRRTCSKLAMDIINFFEVEDRHLNVIFLTHKCEDIPAKVHESEAMKDVYVLLHKTEEDYSVVIDDLRENNTD